MSTPKDDRTPVEGVPHRHKKHRFPGILAIPFLMASLLLIAIGCGGKDEKTGTKRGRDRRDRRKSSLINKAKLAQAKQQIKLLQTAITAYDFQYGYLPFFPANTGYNDVLVNKDPLKTLTKTPYNDLIATLNGSNANLNPRCINFLGIEGQTYLDPWGNEFFVALDLGGDMEISDAAGVNKSQKLYGASIVPGRIAIWSMGPDKAHSEKDRDVSNKDNVNSWTKR